VLSCNELSVGVVKDFVTLEYISVATNLEKSGILREFSEPGKLMNSQGILCNLREKLLQIK